MNESYRYVCKLAVMGVIGEQFFSGAGKGFTSKLTVPILSLSLSSISRIAVLVVTIPIIRSKIIVSGDHIRNDEVIWYG